MDAQGSSCCHGYTELLDKVQQDILLKTQLGVEQLHDFQRGGESVTEKRSPSEELSGPWAGYKLKVRG